MLVTPASLAPLVARIDAVDEHVGGLPDPRVGPRPDLARPDLAVNLHGRGPESHAVLDALAPRHRVGHAAPGWAGPAWDEGPDRPERRRWCDLLAGAGLVTPAEAAGAADDLALSGPAPQRAGGPVVVHPGAAFGAKRWPVDRFAAVARGLAARGHPVVVTGSAAERGLGAAVAAAAGGDDRTGRTDLAALLDLVGSARLVVSGDTGIAHVATALGVPSVTLFGPVGPRRWGPPPGGPHTTLTDAARRRGDRFADDPDPALLAVGVDAVLAACDPLLAAPAPGPGRSAVPSGLERG